jgi:EmrB/QacA subfamily drug resistance transporter
MAATLTQRPHTEEQHGVSERQEHPTSERSAVVQRKGVLLVLVCLAQLMVILDVSIVNVALPSIREGLRFSTTGLQWVVNAYTLTFAGFLLLGGRAADLLGRRRVFLAGTALFALASLACALADSRSLLIGARALQGIGGAVISPASLAIIATSFAEGRERSRALGVWGAMGGLGGSLGVLLGGILTQAFSWPAIFLVNVPIAIGVIVFSRGLIPEGRRETAARHFDASGALLVTGGLTALVYGIVRTDTLGWGSTGVIAPLALGAVLLATFVFVEGRVAQEPLMPLRVFTMARLRAANLIMFLLYASVFAIWFFLSLYLQQVLHYDPLQTGVRFLPMTLSIMITSTLAPRLVARFGERLVLTVGMLVAAIGLYLLTGVHSGGSYVADVLPGGLLAGLGLGLSLVPATIAAVAGVPAKESGLASGMLNTSRLIGGALGLAVLSTIAASQTRAHLLHGASGASALSSGFSVAFAVSAGLSLLGALAAVVLLRARPPAHEASASVVPHESSASAPLAKDLVQPEPPLSSRRSIGETTARRSASAQRQA